MADAERILQDLVSREVICNISHLVCTIRDAVNEGPAFRDYDGEIRRLGGGEPDYDSAAENNDIEVKELDDGDWVWWRKGEPEPFGTEPPKGYRVVEHPEDWRWEEVNDVSSFDDGFQTREEAIDSCWETAAWIDRYNSKEEALDAAFKEEDVDVYDYCTEVYEHWVVTDWFGKKLKDHGEIVEDLCNLTVWGRQCTGQAIYMDGVIARIANHMQILPGQKNDWSVK